MSFYNITYLVLILLVPVVFVAAWARERARQKARERFAESKLFSRIATVEPPGRAYTRTILMALALALLFVAIARPQGGEKVVEEQVEGIEIMLAIDVSRSMLAEDLHPDRLTAIKGVVRDFVEASYGDRIGAIAFAGDAVVVCPLTTDHMSLINFIDRLSVDHSLMPGTGIGSAIHLGVSRFRDNGSGRVMILLTDGENNKGMDPLEALDEAKEAGVRVYTVGIGTSEGAPLPSGEPGAFGVTSYRRDNSGDKIMVGLDDSTLRQIADETGGEYFSVSNESELRTLYSRIAHEGETEFQMRRMVRKDELAPFVLVLAGLLLIMESFFNYFTPAEVRHAGSEA